MNIDEILHSDPSIKWSNTEPKVSEGFSVVQDNVHYYINNVDDRGIARKMNIKTREASELNGDYYIVSSPVIF